MEREERNPGLDKMPKEKGQEPAPALRISPVGLVKTADFGRVKEYLSGWKTAAPVCG